MLILIKNLENVSKNGFFHPKREWCILEAFNFIGISNIGYKECLYTISM